MPAVAHKITPDHHDYHSTAVARPASPAVSNRGASSKVAPRQRWHEEKPAAPQRRAVRGRSTQAAPDARPDSHEVRDLLSHFGHGSAENESRARAQLEAKRQARRRARLHHRPFRLTLTAGVLAGAPLCLLASLLWLRSSALSLSRQDTALQTQISAARFDLERTHKEIAALNASPHIEQWAKERNWRQATQQDFDQVPVAPETAADAGTSAVSTSDASTLAEANSEQAEPAASR